VIRWPDNPISALVRQEIERGGSISWIGVATLRWPGAPLAVRLRWPMDSSPHLVPDLLPHIPRVQITGWAPRADSAIRVEADWSSLREVQRWCEDTAWVTGSAYLRRLSHAPRPCTDPYAMQHGLTHAFGCATWSVQGSDDTIGTGCPDLVPTAARDGYWYWEFGPYFRRGDLGSVYAAELVHARREDRSLRADGSRGGTFPGWIDDELERVADRFDSASEGCIEALYDVGHRRLRTTSYPISARFSGACRRCGARWRRGTRIRWDRDRRHTYCYPLCTRATACTQP